MKLSSSERFVLLLLADNSSWDEETGRWYAFPFQKTLARESGLSERTVKRAISRLLELGLISTERRKRASGFIAGNGYVFHPETVAEPITRTVNDAIEAVEVRNPGPGLARGDTVAPPVVALPTRADREDVRARLNRHSESSSSSVSEAAGATDEERSELGRWRGVDLDALGAQVGEATGLDCGCDELVWLVDAILVRSRRRVGRPASFVRTAIINDPASTRAELLARFGTTPDTVGGSGSGVQRKKSPPCQIPEHSEQGLLKVNCPACRGIWDDPFPVVIRRSVFEQLDGVVKERVLRATGVEVLEDERATA